MRRVIKAIILFLDIILCILVLFFVRIVFFKFPKKSVRIAAKVTQISNRTLAWILGVKISVVGQLNYLKEQGLFLVSNHLSYIDGVTISSIWPLVFIGRSDIKTWPLFGLLTMLSDTIFVNRINPSNIKAELAKIISVLRSGSNVILFPEGTSTDGRALLPFKTSFFEAPLKAGCKIIPLAIRYLTIDSQPVSKRNQDLVYWYGDMYFFPHLMKVLSLKSIEIEVRVFDPLEMSQVKEASFSFQRKYAGNACKEVINNHLNHHEAKK